MSWGSPETRVIEDEVQRILFQFHCRDSSGVHILEFNHTVPVVNSAHQKGTTEYWTAMKRNVDPMQSHMNDCLAHSSKMCHVCHERPADRVLLATKLITNLDTPVLKNLTSVVCASGDCAYTAKESMTIASKKLDQYLAGLELAMWPAIDLSSPQKTDFSSERGTNSVRDNCSLDELKHTRSASLNSATYEIVSKGPPTTAHPHLLNFQSKRLSPIRSSYPGRDLDQDINTDIGSDIVVQVKGGSEIQAAAALGVQGSDKSKSNHRDIKTENLASENQDADDEAGTVDVNSAYRVSSTATSSVTRNSVPRTDGRAREARNDGQRTRAQTESHSNTNRMSRMKDDVRSVSINGDFSLVKGSGFGRAPRQVSPSIQRELHKARLSTSSHQAMEGKSDTSDDILHAYEGQSDCITVQRTVSRNETVLQHFDTPPRVPAKGLNEKTSLCRPVTESGLQNALRVPSYIPPPRPSSSARPSRSIDILDALRELPPSRHGNNGPGLRASSLADPDEDRYSRKWIATTGTAEIRPRSSLSMKPSIWPMSHVRQTEALKEFSDHRCQSAQGHRPDPFRVSEVKPAQNRLRRAAEKMGIRKTKSIDCFANQENGVKSWCRPPATSRLSRCLESDVYEVVKTDRRAGAYDGPDD